MGPNLKVLVDWYNDFGSCITVGILKAKTAKQRWKRVKRCLDMAMQFKENNDFNSLSIVRKALSTNGIGKLHILEPNEDDAHPYCSVRFGKVPSDNHLPYVSFWREMRFRDHSQTEEDECFVKNIAAYIPLI